MKKYRFIICGLVVWGVVLSVKFLYERFFDGTPLLRENRDTHRNSGKRDYPDLC